jgi:hypothetical protein
MGLQRSVLPLQEPLTHISLLYQLPVPPQAGGLCETCACGLAGNTLCTAHSEYGEEPRTGGWIPSY